MELGSRLPLPLLIRRETLSWDGKRRGTGHRLGAGNAEQLSPPSHVLAGTPRSLRMLHLELSFQVVLKEYL